MAAWARAGLLGVTMLAPLPALAEEALVDASDPAAIVDLFRGYGSARLDKADDETPAIRGRIEGSLFSVYFYGCDKSHANCTSLNVTSSWETEGNVSLEAVNAWNRDKRFARGYINASGNAVVETDINLDGGISVANMESNIDWWRVILADFKTNVVDAKPATPQEGDEPAPEADETDDAAAPAAAATDAPPAVQSDAPFAVPRKPNSR